MNNKKRKIIETSFELFCSNGFNATGINIIIDKSKVSKMMMYYYFKNKEELIIEVLEFAHNIFVENVLQKVEKSKASAKKKILSLFEILFEISKEKDLVRCVFINATAEFSDIKNPIHQVTIRHQKSIEDFIKNALKKDGFTDVKYLARTINLTLQGALVMVQTTNDKKYYLDAKKLVAKIL